MRDFQALIEEAMARPFAGWDLSFDGRIISTPPRDFAGMVGEAARGSPDMLDMGTGGGEWLSKLPHRPARTVATEGWTPNVPVARARLGPIGIEVIAVRGAPDNVDQTDGSEGGTLPFPNETFHLVVNRHESYLPREVLRILAPGGVFLTEQVGSDASDEFYRLLGQSPPTRGAVWDLAFAVRQLADTGLVIEDSAQGFETMSFADVGALAWYLKNVPSIYEGFSIEAARGPLERLHKRAGGTTELIVRLPIFWLKARKPEG